MGGNRSRGDRGEALAAGYLEARGYTVVARNFRAPGGEVDLVCRQEEDAGSLLVFVEVKLRRGTAFGRPEEAVDARKQERIAAAAEAYLAEHGLDDAACRFDVVAIQETRGPARIAHIVDAFGH